MIGIIKSNHLYYTKFPYKIITSNRQEDIYCLAKGSTALLLSVTLQALIS